MPGDSTPAASQAASTSALNSAPSAASHPDPSACPIVTVTAGGGGGGVLMALPPATFPLPREKPLPGKKAETTWERFAKKKGIRDRKRGEGGREYDAGKGEWVPKVGVQGAE
ncbi:hypothetical protein HO173_009457 [Letharia columbiana]|uniref:Ribosome biogenesis regulatory protein n=1 Tax=Letharia columbiana TaxID=112416 RepID=A0A8H6L1T3_9LECA|nr:uncharacterized protein HO173_009457 [Letharia columbiana]KAF6232352.1 hypothetical protein HO173_009457 [Letharia columbiana]